MQSVACGIMPASRAYLIEGIIFRVSFNPQKIRVMSTPWACFTLYISRRSHKTNGLKYADVVKVVAALKRGYASGACWAMNNAALYNLFYSMVDSNGRPIFIADPKAEGIGKILGFPVVVDDYLPAETILFGNFNYMGYNLPEGITIEASRESSFKSGRIDYRAMAVADCKPIVDATPG